MYSSLNEKRPCIPSETEAQTAEWDEKWNSQQICGSVNNYERHCDNVFQHLWDQLQHLVDKFQRMGLELAALAVDCNLTEVSGGGLHGLTVHTAGTQHSHQWLLQQSHFLVLYKEHVLRTSHVTTAASGVSGVLNAIKQAISAPSSERLPAMGYDGGCSPQTAPPSTYASVTSEGLAEMAGGSVTGGHYYASPYPPANYSLFGRFGVEYAPFLKTLKAQSAGSEGRGWHSSFNNERWGVDPERHQAVEDGDRLEVTGLYSSHDDALRETSTSHPLDHTETGSCLKIRKKIDPIIDESRQVCGQIPGATGPRTTHDQRSPENNSDVRGASPARVPEGEIDSSATSGERKAFPKTLPTEQQQQQQQTCVTNASTEAGSSEDEDEDEETDSEDNYSPQTSRAEATRDELRSRDPDLKRPSGGEHSGATTTTTTTNHGVKTPSRKRKPCLCDICNEYFGRRNFGRHMKVMHGQAYAKPECRYCSQPCRDALQRARHELSAHDVPADMFQCDSCERKYLTKVSLRNHHKVAHGDGRFPCGECHGSFRSRFVLREHVRVVHRKRKDFHCVYCGKTFARSYTLQNHERTHTGDKSLRCGYCAFTSIQHASLKYHVERKHPGQTYKYLLMTDKAAVSAESPPPPPPPPPAQLGQEVWDHGKFEAALTDNAGKGTLWK